jgi:serine/threonine-protein kinase
LRGSVFKEVNPDPQRGSASAQQAVIAYPSADAAKAALEKQVEDWRGCANRSVFRKVDPADPSAEVKFGDVVTADDNIYLISQAVGPSGVACDRGLDLKINVVIDSIVCRSDSATQQVLDLVRGIADQVR